MARMYSRRHGRSSSTKPQSTETPSWVTYSSEEVVNIVLKLAKEDKDTAAIGLILRDKYGVPSVKNLCGKSVSKILEEGDMKPEIPSDLLSLLKRVVFIRKHLEGNHKDQPAKRGLRLTESKIGRLINYYKKSKKLPQDWTYDLKKIRFLTE